MRVLLMLVVLATTIQVGAAKSEKINNFPWNKKYTEWRKQNCKGVWQKDYTCDDGNNEISGQFCIEKNEEGNYLFNDGCTGMPSKWAMLFHPACVKHDDCYHFEPATNGYSRRECDTKFLLQLAEICGKTFSDPKEKENCDSKAKFFYKVFDLVPSISDGRYDCVNQKGKY